MVEATNKAQKKRRNCVRLFFLLVSFTLTLFITVAENGKNLAFKTILNCDIVCICVEHDYTEYAQEIIKIFHINGSERLLDEHLYFTTPE